MSRKMICLGCDAESSTVTAAFEDGRDCPFCGLPANATVELLAAERRGADAKLIERHAEMAKELAAAQRRASELETVIHDIRLALSEVTR